MLPQTNVNHQQEKLENYLFDTLDTNKVFFNHLVDSLDKFTGHTFTTYSSRIKNSLEYNIENAKEIIRTGKHKCPTCASNKV
jgi:hypothetical protein